MMSIRLDSIDIVSTLFRGRWTTIWLREEQVEIGGLVGDGILLSNDEPNEVSIISYGRARTYLNTGVIHHNTPCMSDENPYSPRKTQKEEILDDLKRVGASHGQKLTLDEYTKRGEYSQHKVYRYFDSYTDALRKADLFPVGRFNRRDVIRAINKLGEELNRPPMPQEMDTEGVYSATVVAKEFEGYREALSEAGYSEEEIDRHWDTNKIASTQGITATIEDDCESSSDEHSNADLESIKESEETSFDPQDPVTELHNRISGVGQASCGKLHTAGFETVGDLRAASKNDIVAVKYVGPAIVETLLEHISTDRYHHGPSQEGDTETLSSEDASTSQNGRSETQNSLESPENDPDSDILDEIMNDFDSLFERED